jgi:DNA invertase Pin-like site-specific DNA recombinase
MIPNDVRCIGYARVSTERQADADRTSIADQVAAINAKAAKLGLEVGAWFKDEGASGATVAERPAFREMLVACEALPRSAKSPGVVLVLNDSRFGRFPDPDEAAALRFRLKQAGWHVRFCESDDVEDITFRSVIRSLGSAQASEYRRNIQRNARRGSRGSAENGFWTREAPLGYRRVVVGSGRVLERGILKAPNERVSLIPHAEEAALVQWMFEAYATGEESLGTLAAKLLKLFPGRRWSRTTVQHVLCNHAYVGDIAGGRRWRASADGGQEKLQRAPSDNWFERRDTHPAIVSRALFATVARKLAENRKRRTGSVDYLMSGFMRCPYCDARFWGGGVANCRPHIPRERRHMYIDSGGKLGVCEGRIGTIMRHLIDDSVLDTIDRTLRAPGVQRQIAADVDEWVRGAVPSADNTLAAIAQREASLARQKERLVEAIADGIIERREASAKLERLRADLLQCERDRTEVRAATRRVIDVEEERDRLVGLAANFGAVASNLSGPKLRNLVLPWLEDAVFDKIERVLTLKILRIPGDASLLMYGQPARG